MSEPFSREIVEEVLEEAPIANHQDQPVVVTLPLEVYNELVDSLRELQKDVTTIKEQVTLLVPQGLAPAPSTSKEDSLEPIRELMPLTSVEGLIEFDKMLEAIGNKSKFVCIEMRYNVYVYK